MRLGLLIDSLDGLSVGDALGERYFGVTRTVGDLRAGRLPDAPWRWTDDTCMGSTLAAHVARHGTVDQERLIRDFVDDFDIRRGYGHGAVDLLTEVRLSIPWRAAAHSSFGGTGSCGNGAAMRVAPLGAWFHDDLHAASLQAARSAEVTHAHPEGIAGAVAVARVASYLADARLRRGTPDAERIIAVAAEGVSGSVVSFGLGQAANRLGAPLDEVVDELGNGRQVTAQDTVPFCVWVVATWPTDYPAAIAACVEARGDIDTTCAIVGGMIAAYTGVGDHDDVRGVPAEWLAAREPLPPAARSLRAS